MEIKISILNEFNTELSTYVTDLDSYELSKKHNILIEKSIDEMIHKLHFEQENKNTITEIPNPAEFMNLGKDAFNKNKQETLEEAADVYSKRSNASVFQENHKRDFINGAKWQQERMCNHTYILTSEQGHRVIKCQKCDDTQPI